MNKKLTADQSRRKFVKVAVATAYVSPLVVSMPAKACITHTGSIDNGVCDDPPSQQGPFV